MQTRNVRREYRTQTGSANCFDSCILAWKILRRLEADSLFFLDIELPTKIFRWLWTTQACCASLGEWRAEGARCGLAAGTVCCRMVSGWAGRVSGFQVPLRCRRQHTSLPCFLWQWRTSLPSNPAAGKAQTSVLSSLQVGVLFIIPNLSAKSKMTWCV